MTKRIDFAEVGSAFERFLSKVRVRALGPATVAALSLLGVSPEAHACGGCFAADSDSSSSFVTSHRMAFSISPERTVLWDQFSYSGDPEDFSWVLPVLPGAYLELADDAFLQALDQVTAPTVYEPPANCFGGFDDHHGGGCGCALAGSDDDAESANADGGFYAPPVVVVSEETIGPYETVVLRSTDDGALVRWLEANGYVVPPNILPIIDAYVSEGFDFLALRLSPGNGVDQMSPVRVVTPEGPPVLPLRMVAAGVGSKVQMTLFVFANTAMQIPDLMDVRIAPEDVTWDYATDTSNYDQLVAERLSENDGHVHLTTYVKNNPFIATSEQPNGFGPVTFSTATSSVSENLDQLYFRLAGESDNLQSIGEACASEIRNYGSRDRVTAACEGNACSADPLAGLGGSAGMGMSQGGGAGAEGMADVDEQQGDFACGGFTDIQAALIGHIPRNVWLTRLDMDLPLSALERDCALTASEEGEGTVEPHFEAGLVENHPCPDERALTTAMRSEERPQDRLPPWSFGVFAVAAWWWRRRTRKTPLLRAAS